jgi:23S rRNA A2030 N6-methylase RlmJ
MKSIHAVALAAATLFAAQAQAQTANPLEIYAGFAKLNENIAEAAGAVMLGTHPDADEALRAEAISDFRGDLTQLDGYVAGLRALPLSPDQRRAIDFVAREWAKAADAAEDLIGNRTATPAEVAEWWESLDEIDDTVDDVLEDILRDENVTS